MDLRYHVERLYQDPVLGPLLSIDIDRTVPVTNGLDEDEEMASIYMSPMWKSAEKLGPHVLKFLGFADGFNPQQKRIQCDIWPLALKCLNLPEYLANLAENISLVSLCDVGKPKTYEGYNKLFLRDLLIGYYEGFKVTDWIGNVIVVKVVLVGWVGDLPGCSLLACQQVLYILLSSYASCFFCALMYVPPIFFLVN